MHCSHHRLTDIASAVLQDLQSPQTFEINNNHGTPFPAFFASDMSDLRRACSEIDGPRSLVADCEWLCIHIILLLLIRRRLRLIRAQRRGGRGGLQRRDRRGRACAGGIHRALRLGLRLRLGDECVRAARQADGRLRLHSHLALGGMVVVRRHSLPALDVRELPEAVPLAVVCLGARAARPDGEGRVLADNVVGVDHTWDPAEDGQEQVEGEGAVAAC